MRRGEPEPARAPLELWVGPESSYVRAGALVTDELALSGFGERPGDLERLASLGAGAVRFPLLWEKTLPQPASPDWRWADRALPELARRGLRPVVGLVHHGGGPLPQGVLDAGFADGLAAFAGEVARRYPWLDAYTPVNEPLTTARFSALYGHWHPHAHSDAAFVQALLNQLRGTVLGMRAVRRINPDAALVQTEDMGRVYGTVALQEQVEFENLRRWLSLDLLCGRVDEAHGLWPYLMWAGATPEQVLWFAGHPCPPQVIGLNVYPTSERFLDERLERYPARYYGGNGRQAYADVEALRVRPELPGLFFDRLLEAHARYGLPMALSEVHLGSTREEQLRWLNTAWQDALRAREAGADVRAVTAWAAFGSFEWDSLLTEQRGTVETGLWDVRGDEATPGTPRETALAALARDLALGLAPTHPVLAGPGWWQRAERVQYPPDAPVEALPVAGRPIEIRPGPQALLLGELCRVRGLPLGKTDAWARIESANAQTLVLHWLGQEFPTPRPLQVCARFFSAACLNAALDLLVDREEGVWVWDGHGLTSVAAPTLPLSVPG